MLNTVLVFLIGSLATFFSVPTILSIARKKINSTYVEDPINALTKIPALGGIAIFFGFILATFSFVPWSSFPDIQYITLAAVLMFVLGLKDDFEAIGPWFKLVAQLIIVTLLFYNLDIKLDLLNPVLGKLNDHAFIKIIPPILLSMFILNSINFLDGINGLCGSISIVILVVLGSYFFLLNDINHTTISFALSGALISFLYYNITPARVFMGDTGSLFVGLLISYLSIQFLNLKANTIIIPSFSILLGILTIPTFDAIRVMLQRVLAGNSPFKKDKNHIHHLLLELGFSHMKATTILILMNLVFILITIIFQKIGDLKLSLLLFSVATISTTFIILKVKQHSNKQILNRF